MSTLRTSLAIALSIALGLSFAITAGGCVANVGGPPGGDDDGDDDGTEPPPPPPPEPPPPAPAIYKRGSLQPVFQLTPRGEYGRFTEGGVTMADADFISTAGNFVTTAQKMDEIGAQIGRERGLAAVNHFPPMAL